jgi:hypothetical protein
VEEETLKKVVPHSVATALANMVFPVPGGPTIKTPFHGRRIPCNGNHNKHTGSKLTEGLGHRHRTLYLKTTTNSLKYQEGFQRAFIDLNSIPNLKQLQQLLKQGKEVENITYTERH